ncbi:MAG TPA: tetratricopeptide repeat protein [Acidobacteriaceae bacterium]|nr:tetratricopeptide repeat protein [Acidobacteriaceae bacterium]
MSLTLITIAIGVLTYFFFHSFAEHRSVLEKRWYDRGQVAMKEGHPAEAVEDFRSALSFSATNTDYQMSLAEALAAAGRTDEADAYFATLHDAEPGDGFLNLQLARLAVRRGNAAQAIEYYQAALNGSWRGQGTERRLQIRLELAEYLISLARPIEAQGQLLAAEGNSLDDPTALFNIANLLRQADDPTDALTTYQRVERHRNAAPAQVLASLDAESQILASMGQYKRAAQALTRYMTRLRQHPSAGTPQQNQAVEQQLEKYQRILQLIPFDSLPPRLHDARLLQDADIAHQRYQTCLQSLQSSNDANATNPDLLALGTQWTELGSPNVHALEGNAPLQTRITTWISQAETVTAKVCGPPKGDDALLLQIAQTPDKTE